MVSHPPRGPRRDRGLASSLQRRAAAHEPELLDPDRVPIAASTPVHDPQPSRLPGMNGLRILGHVNPAQMIEHAPRWQRLAFRPRPSPIARSPAAKDLALAI